MRTFDSFEAAREVPDRVALVHAQGECTYAELADLVHEAAGGLHAQGLLQGSRVLFEAEATLQDVVRVLAFIAYGVPIVMVHPRLGADEKARITELAQPALTVGPWLDLGAAPPRPKGIDPRRPLAVFFTSGSSGQPKGAVLSYGALATAVQLSARNLGWQDDDRWLLSIPLAHIGGFSVLLRCLSARRTVVLGRAGVQGFVEGLREHRVTLGSLVPTQLYRLLQGYPGLKAPAYLRALLVGGASASQSLLQQARDLGWPVLATYGLTEACAQVATDNPVHPAPAGSVGRPLLPDSIRIRAGHIEIRGPMLMSGYLGDAELPPEAWFDTEDLGRLDAAGNLYVHGRRSDLVVSGGENVYPLEVEDALRGLPEVQDAQVFGREDPEWGQVVCAVIAPAGVDLQGVQVALRARMAGFKRPRLWATTDVLALTGSGKPDRRRTAVQFDGVLKPV